MNGIDLNCDMGEGFGVWCMGDDRALLAVVSSANVACGFHAGDPGTMRTTARLALERGVAVGAHPSLPDLQGFGRREMHIGKAEAYDLVVYQVAALAGICRTLGGRLNHVKPHGALYNMAARDGRLAEAVARAVADLDRGLVLYALAGRELVRAGRAAGLRVASEVFADRTYQPDGTLTPRSRPDAVIADAGAALAQVERMLGGEVQAVDGSRIAIEADTLCIHGDTPGAVAFAQRIRARLAELDVAVRPVTGTR